MKAKLFAGLVALFGTPGALRAGGECTAVVEDGVLVIEGDDLDNSIVVSETPEPGSGVFLVVGEDGTLVNGGESDTLSGRIQYISIDLKDGVNAAEVKDVEIAGDVTVCGGEGFNEFKLKDSVVGGCVEVDNEEGDTKTSIKGSEVGEDVEVSNDEGFDEFELEDSLVVGDVDVSNDDGNDLDEGSDSGIGDGALVGGDLTVRNVDGFDEFDLEEESEILGDLSIRNATGGSGVDIEVASIGGDLKVKSSSGFDEVNLDDTLVGGDVDLRFKSGGSDFLTESSTGEGNVTIGGSLFLEANGTYADTVTLDVLLVTQETEIHTGPGDDFVTIVNSTFEDDVDLQGHSGIDTETDGGGNTFLGDTEIEDFEISLP